MKILVIIGHPDQKSFNHAIAETAVKTLHKSSHQVVFHDLYRENYPPLLTSDEILQSAELPPLISEHVNDLVTADGVIIVHPNWWGQPPAVLKGWIDRIIRPGAAYEFNEGDSGEGVPKGLLKARAAVVFTTSNTPAEREQAVFGDPLETIWKNCVFGLCGVSNFYRRNFGVIVTSTADQRKQWLKEVEDIVSRYFP